MLTKLHKGTRGISDEGLMRVARETKAGFASEKSDQMAGGLDGYGYDSDSDVGVVKDLMSKLTQTYGGEADVAFAEDNANYANNPNLPGVWIQYAYRIDGNNLEYGKVFWDFSEYDEQRESEGFPVEDASDYPWDAGFDDFTAEERFDLTDPDEVNDAIVQMKKDLGLRASKKDQSEDVWDLYKRLEESLGSEELAMNLAKAMGTDLLKENLDYIAQMGDLNVERLMEE